MTDQKRNQNEPHDENDGLQFRGLGGRRLSIGGQAMQSLIEATAPHLKMVVLAIAWAVFIVSTCYALSFIL